jgi:undecaprenyl-diphosphatase
VDIPVILIGKYALLLVALGAALAWVLASRRDKVTMLVAGAVTLVLTVIAIKLAALAWVDPRPFVVDGRAPLIPHPADNGFPSDHTTLGAAIAVAVLAWRRWLGAGLLVVAVAVGAARVAAHVHHVPDVVAGLVIGSACAVAGVLLARRGTGAVRNRASAQQDVESG